MIVRVSQDPSKQVVWQLLDKNGLPTRTFNEKSIEYADIYVLVPGVDVFLTELKLPKLSRSQERKAIPFSLEMKLAEVWPHFHYVTARGAGVEKLPVAVVSRAKMDEWQIQLNVFFRMTFPGIKIMMPDMLALPLEPSGWTVYVDNDMRLVRTGLYSGFSIERHAFWDLLRLLLKDHSTTPPEIMTVIGELDIPDRERFFLEERQIALKEEASQDLLSLAETQVETVSGMNLLQGFLHTKINYFQGKLYYLSGILFVIIFMIFVCGTGFQYAILKETDNHLNQYSNGIYEQYFPKDKTAGNNEKERHLETLLRGMTGTFLRTNFLSTLNEVAPVLSKETGIQVMAIRFVPHQLTLQLEADSVLSEARLIQMFKDKGYKITKQDEVRSGKRIKSNIVIEMKNI